MLYCFLKEESNDAIEAQFDCVYSIIKTIRENKEDIIYKSSIPRMKQTKLRGVQAFKEVIKKLSYDEKPKYDENIKCIWLKCFKMVYNFNSYALNLNARKCITFDKELTYSDIKEYLNIENFELSKKEPNYLHHEKEEIDAIFNYIKGEALSEKNLKKLIAKLFSELL